MLTATGGTRYYRRRHARPVTSFAFDAASHDEGFGRHLEMQSMAGIDQDIGFIVDRRRREDQLVLRLAGTVAHATRAGHRRGDTRWQADGGGDAG